MIFFTIFGNQDDLKGNPIGYTRTTQRQKFVDPQAKRYEAWKDYVWVSLLKVEPHPPRFEGKVAIDCYIEYKDKRHTDPGNVVKGIADALADCKRRGILERRLYPNDRHVLERAMDFSYSDDPGVLVVISEL